jgi:hypothetical protein
VAAAGPVPVSVIEPTAASAVGAAPAPAQTAAFKVSIGLLKPSQPPSGASSVAPAAVSSTAGVHPAVSSSFSAGPAPAPASPQASAPVPAPSVPFGFADGDMAADDELDYLPPEWTQAKQRPKWVRFVTRSLNNCLTSVFCFAGCRDHRVHIYKY